MTINAGDIKLVTSQVMDDTASGGGRPTGTVIQDAVSNSIFSDISEVDRAGGNVSLRKVFPSVRTSNTDSYFGANVIVADPPDDPRVSVTLFSTGDTFDRRSDAKSRMEAYLAQGPMYSGYLFGNHIAGMRTVTLLQREEIADPVVGDTLVLRAYEGTVSQVEQFVRVTDVSSLVRTFTDTSGDFKRKQVTLDISDALRYDLPGFDAIRIDAAMSYTNKTKTYSTIVADAARYYGIVPLENAASTGNYVVKATGMFSQLVPSTRIEVPIADARMNQQLQALTSAGSALSRTLTQTFSASQPMYVGGSILPGSLSVSRSGITITDSGGVLFNAGAQCGTVDYANGVLTLTTSVFGTAGGSHDVTYTPAMTPTVVSESLGLEVTQASQRLTWVVTLDPIPAKASLQVSYRTLGRWYVLTDDGSGALRGTDSSFGAGMLNYSTGTVTLTLGALPDVDSRIILVWAPNVSNRPLQSVPPVGPSLSRAFGRQIVLPKGIKAGTLTITWNDGSARSATDNGSGGLTGDASGLIMYSAGLIQWRPVNLPAKNTTVTVTVSEAVAGSSSIGAFTDGGSVWTFNIGGVKARSVEIGVVCHYPKREYPGVDATQYEAIRVFDDGAGNLQVANSDGNLTVGAVNYVTGACSINKSVSGFKSNQGVWENKTPMGASGDPSSYIRLTGYELRTVALSFDNGPGSNVISSPAWAWWSGALSSAAQARFTGSDGTSGDVYTFSLDYITMPAGGEYSPWTGSIAISVRSFKLGSDYYSLSGTSNYIANMSGTTGAGSPVGDVVSEFYTGMVVRLTTWTAGVSSAPTSVNGVASSQLSGVNSDMLVSQATFRTAVSPLVNSGFSVAGTRKDNVAFTASANASGIIKTGGDPLNADSIGTFGVFGVVDYETGVVDLRFGQACGANKHGLTGVIDISALGIPGVTHIVAVGVQSDSLRYNAVGYSYLPLDANLLGLDPVRLPADGRVPVFRSGSFAVIGHTATVGPITVSNGQTINCARVRLSRVRVIDNNGAVIDTGYSADLDAGLVTFSNVSGYAQPVRVEHRIEDMMLVSDAQINGQLTFTRPVSHDYPIGSYVSSALVIGNMKARYESLFDQATWSNTWINEPSGSVATGTYNDALYPIGVSNNGALTERWALVFINSTSFQIIGEHVGVIGTGNTTSDCAPLNPATGEPYFTLEYEGWGLGWATGNVLRFNTIGAQAPVWVARTVLQGPETVINDSFTLLVRGDIDRP